MSAWLAPVRAALADAPAPVRIFVRDDDAGRAEAQLERLLDIFEVHDAPLDLAVIPATLRPRAAEALRRRRARWPGLSFHQHGYAHVNHEPEGRKCEFGPARALLRQHADIRMGKDRLLALLGPTDPIFTPPWNRCTQDTISALEREGFQVLSTEAKAAALCLRKLYHLPVCVDWRRTRAGVRQTPEETAAAIADQMGASGAAAMGLMLHHEVLQDDDFSALGALLALLRTSPNVRLGAMMAMVEKQDVSLVKI
jgi:predicted deacetylase